MEKLGVGAALVIVLMPKLGAGAVVLGVVFSEKAGVVAGAPNKLVKGLGGGLLSPAPPVAVVVPL